MGLSVDVDGGADFGGGGVGHLSSEGARHFASSKPSGVTI